MSTAYLSPFAIETFHKEQLSDAEWNALANLYNQERLEIDPELRPMDGAELRRRLSTSEDFYHEEHWWVWNAERSEVIARAEVGYLVNMPTNQHLANFEIMVAPAYRQRGLGRALLRPVVATLAQAGRHTLSVHTTSVVPAGIAFVERLGAQAGLQMVTNDLQMAALDVKLLQSWIDRAQERAADYDLLFLDGAYPPALLPAMAEMFQLMNTAPRENMPFEDIHWTPEQLSQMDANLKQAGVIRWSVVARQRATGRLVGYSSVFWSAFQPFLLNQGDTAVHPDHRGKGLGRWLKAAMLQRVRQERPEVRRVRTGNAGSNAPMLQINHELGFRPFMSNTLWHLPLEKAQAYLAAAG